MMERRKNSMSNQSVSIFVKCIITILLAVTIGTCYLFYKDNSNLNNAYVDLNSIEYLSSSTQRLVRLTLNNQIDQKVVFIIDEATTNSLTLEGAKSLSVFEYTEFLVLAEEVAYSWEILSEEVGDLLELISEGETPNYATLNNVAETHFKSMTNLSQEISNYTVELNERINQHQLIIMTCVFAIATVMFNNSLQTHTELKLTKTLAANAQIDEATGLFNRSRCQELFKADSVTGKRRRGILVFDLNDLKQTNDSLGHRAGDDLIQGFASVLKSASNVHVLTPFIGRYGGDEFIVYYEDTSGEEEIKTYLTELDYYVSEFNERETRFQISFAVGYAFITDEKEEQMTTRQLFDKADAAMYANKIAVKRAKNPNYDEQAAKGEVR